MAIHFRTSRVKFDPTKGRIQRETASANFSSNVRRCGVAINGFQAKFTHGDHHVWEEMINIEEGNMQINAANVSVPVSFLLRDASGNIDDTYEGFVDVLFIAETA